MAPRRPRRRENPAPRDPYRGPVPHSLQEIHHVRTAPAPGPMVHALVADVPQKWNTPSRSYGPPPLAPGRRSPTPHWRFRKHPALGDNQVGSQKLATRQAATVSPLPGTRRRPPHGERQFTLPHPRSRDTRLVMGLTREARRWPALVEALAFEKEPKHWESRRSYRTHRIRLEWREGSPPHAPRLRRERILHREERSCAAQPARPPQPTRRRVHHSMTSLSLTASCPTKS